MVSNNAVDDIIEKAIFSEDAEVKKYNLEQIRRMASAAGIYLASIQGLYEAAAKGAYARKTVPAINIRGLTYLTARTIFKSALKHKVGAFIFEIARTEIAYTNQSPDEYVTSVLAAAIKERFSGPVFVQGDHFQLNQKKYTADPRAEVKSVEDSTREAIAAGFLNIDIDSSTL
ncbi:aldolase, partial [Chloroflexota bacterium]